ncbi:hypothetical protein MLD38_015674 [Melastoma candidum]|uniref:Uncharacterized protein n=1 Tax=Melastoma candidum TaxID=119954 RepID=A0ACB9RI87_9MYRT|nr:hypothetical protein MLD38_015674 [Melastoma candidum]
MVSREKVILGSAAFLVFWVLAVFPSFPLLPIGRTAGALLGGLFMVVFGLLTPTEAYSSIDLQILGLLFGTMVVGKYLERANMFNYLAKLLSWKSIGPKDLLCRVCVVSALSSALFTNDTSCTVLTEFVLRICRQQKLPPHPFLLALASSANIGSATTPIGNPQNLVIAIESGMFTFLSFTLGLLPATLVGIMINAALLLVMYWKELSIPHPHNSIVEGECASLLEDAESAIAAPDLSNTFNVELTADVAVEGQSSEKWKALVWKSCVYLITVGMLVVLLMGMNMSWTAIGAALAMIALDFKDAAPCLEKVSYSILVFFCGMFISVEGFKCTGIPALLWEYTEAYTKVDTVSGIAILTVVILVLSNLVSNVPTVLLLGLKLAASAAAISTEDEKKAWLILAWASTIAGNLSLLGSAANLIVCEQACRSSLFAYELTFLRHLVFGIPSTLLVTIVGLTLIK